MSNEDEDPIFRESLARQLEGLPGKVVSLGSSYYHMAAIVRQQWGGHIADEL